MDSLISATSTTYHWLPHLIWCLWHDLRCLWHRRRRLCHQLRHLYITYSAITLSALLSSFSALYIVSALHLYPTQPPPLFRTMFPRSATLLVIILRHHSFISASSFISADQVLSRIISFWSSFSVLHWWCTSLVIPSSFPRHSFVITLYLYSMLHLFPRSAPLLLRSAIPLWPLLHHSATQVLDWDYTFCSIYVKTMYIL